MAGATKLLFCPPTTAAAAFYLHSNGIHRVLIHFNSIRNIRSNNQEKKKAKSAAATAAAMESQIKRRTRSERKFDQEHVLCQFMSEGGHVPVMLGEVLEAFGRKQLRSFIDCTVGAAGHSSAIIRAHSEMQLYIGLDIDPMAHEMAQSHINAVLNNDSCSGSPRLRAHILLKNFRHIKSVVGDIGENLKDDGVDGILMDLGMSSLQVNNAERGFSLLNDGPLDMRMDPRGSLKAEDILNSWPGNEVGRILREYGEESNWHSLQRKILEARLAGGLHSTGELVRLVQHTSGRSGGRQGWIKTATRVFQALRIAVNDELKALEDALRASFDCLASSGRLAVISFHSLEDRIVKRTFLDIINQGDSAEQRFSQDLIKEDCDTADEHETWCKQRIIGRNGTILTKRPVTPSVEEERLNCRCRSAKLRVIQKG